MTWVQEFEMAVGRFLIQEDRYSPGLGRMPVPGELAVHMQDCTLTQVTEVDQEVTDVDVFDSFDAYASRPAAYVSARITCKCEKYAQHYLQAEGGITDILRGVATA